MAWTSDDWKQDSSVFYGYPIPVSAVGVPEIPDISDFGHPWIFDNLFYDYPHHEDSLKPDALDISNFKHPWIFDNAFYGYPHVFIFPVKHTYPIFTSFSMNGMGADFRQISRSRAVSLPEQIRFKFDIKEHIKL